MKKINLFFILLYKTIDFNKTIIIVITIIIVRSYYGKLLVVTMLGQIMDLYHLPASYHNFADERYICGVYRFADVISNIGFLISGILFVKEILLKGEKNLNLILVAVGSILIFFGSSYYHLLPQDSRLLWV